MHAELDDWAEAGFDAIYLMGVWQTGDNGVLNAQKKLLAIRAQCPKRAQASAAAAHAAGEQAAAAARNATLAAGAASGAVDTAGAAAAAAAAAATAAEEYARQQKNEEDVEGEAPLEAAVGFHTAIVDYSVHVSLGGDGELEKLRARLHARGLRLILDFVSNHLAADHPWTITNPDFLVRGSAEDLMRAPHNFFQVCERAADTHTSTHTHTHTHAHTHTLTFTLTHSHTQGGRGCCGDLCPRQGPVL